MLGENNNPVKLNPPGYNKQIWPVPSCYLQDILFFCSKTYYIGLKTDDLSLKKAQNFHENVT